MDVSARYMYQYLLIFVIITLKIIDGDPGSFSCPVSRETVQSVEGCPETEEEWKQAAKRKNCSQHANQCDEPARLVYHCLINPFVNETLEVCAYPQNIVHGVCAEYNEKGNVVQGNYETDCTRFWTGPCPEVYLSDSSFKYPGCYQLVKKSDVRLSDSTTISLNYTEISSNYKKKNNISIVVVVTTFVIFLLVFTLFPICLIRRNRRMNRRNVQNHTKCII